MANDVRIDVTVNADQATAELQRLAQAVDALNGEFSQINKTTINPKVGNLAGAMDKVKQSSNGLMSSFGQLAGAASGGAGSLVNAFASGGAAGLGLAAAMGVISAATAALSAGFDTFVEKEKFGIFLDTITKDTDVSKRVLADLVDFAATTPLEMPEIQKASKILLAFGTSTDELRPRLTEIGNLAAATGAPFDELATIFGQVQAAGKLTGERLTQLQERGVPIGAELAKSLGVAEAQITKLTSEGKISAAEFGKAISAMSAEGGVFEGLMEKQSQTLGGLISTMKDNINIFFSDIIETFAPVIKPIVAGISEAFGVLGAAFSYIRTTFSGLFSEFKSAESGVNALTMVFQFLGGYIKSMFITYIDIMYNNIKSVVNVFAELWNQITLVWGIFADLVGVTKEENEAMAEGEKAGNALGKVYIILTSVFRGLMATLVLLIQTWNALVVEVFNGVNKLSNLVGRGDVFKVPKDAGFGKLKKDFDAYTKAAGNWFMEEKKAQDETGAAADEAKKKTEAAAAAAAKAGKPIVIKIEADLKPFESALKKMETDMAKARDKMADEGQKFALQVAEAVGGMNTIELMRARAKLEEDAITTSAQREAEAARQAAADRQKEAEDKLKDQRDSEMKRISELIKDGKAGHGDLLRAEAQYQSELQAVRTRSAQDAADTERQATQLMVNAMAARAQKITLAEIAIEKEREKIRADANRRRIAAEAELRTVTARGLFFEDERGATAKAAEDLRKLDEQIEESRKQMRNDPKLAQALLDAESAYFTQSLRIRKQYDDAVAEMDKRRITEEYERNRIATEAQLAFLESSLRDSAAISAKFAMTADDSQPMLKAFAQAQDGIAALSVSGARIATDTRQQQAEDEQRIIAENLKAQRDAAQERMNLAQYELQTRTDLGDEERNALQERLAQEQVLYGALEAQTEEAEEELTRITAEGNAARLDAWLSFASQAAEVVGQLVNQVYQANIDKLSESIDKQREQANTTRQALKQGGEAAEEYSVRQLEAEEQRLAETEKLRKQEIEKQRAATAIQLALQTAILIAKSAAATAPASYIGIASALASLAIGLALARSQGQAFAASARHGVAIDDRGRPVNDRGIIQGQSHEFGGTPILAQKGEQILSREDTRAYQLAISMMAANARQSLAAPPTTWHTGFTQSSKPLKLDDRELVGALEGLAEEFHKSRRAPVQPKVVVVNRGAPPRRLRP